MPRSNSDCCSSIWAGVRTRAARSSACSTVPQPRTVADFTRAGRAARALGQFKVANDEYFRRGNRLAPADVALNTAWGDLFLEKGDRPNALKSYQDALKADETHVAARVGLARVASEGNPPAAREALEAALKINPNSVPAHLLSAELALDDRRRDEAEASIGKALDGQPEQPRSDCAAGRRRVRRQQACRGRDPRASGAEDQPDLRRGLPHRRRPRRARLPVRRGRGVRPQGAHHRPEQRAGVRRPRDVPAAHRRRGRGARWRSRRAFKDDPFNVSTFNSLDLLDTLAKFETITDGDLVFKFHPDEVAVMREQAIPLAKEALAALSKRYQFTPRARS